MIPGPDRSLGGIASLFTFRETGPAQRRRYWLPEGWTAPLDAPRASHTQTDAQIARAKARAEAKRAKRRARNLALRDLARLRSMQDAIARAEALQRWYGARLLVGAA